MVDKPDIAAQAPNVMADKTKDQVKDTLSNTAEAAKTAQDAGADMTRKGLDASREAMSRAQNETQRMAQRGMEMGAQTMNAYVAAGRQTSELVGEVNKAMADAYGRSLSNYDELSKQAMSCRTLQDVMSLQHTAVEKLQDNMKAMSTVYTLYVDGLTRVMQPIADQATKTQRDAVAA